MTLDENMFRRARQLKHADVVRLLGEYYSTVYRMAVGLCGREDAGRGTARFVMARAVRLLPSWGAEMDPWRWFAHYTVIMSRRASKHQPEPANDVLVKNASTQDTAYVAFVRALRKLHPQQREAILLSYGETLNPRQMAVAMDCSMEAAANHMNAGLGVLRTVAPNINELMAVMTRAYAEITPNAELVLPSIKRLVNRRLLPRRLTRWTIAVLAIAAIAWALHRWGL